MGKLRMIAAKCTKPLNDYVNNRVEMKLQKLVPRNDLRFEVHLAEHCNLNCKGCDNFSPLAKKEFADMKELERDCRRLSELFNGKIERLQLLGGEPLLHPQVNEIMRMVRGHFPMGVIQFITNGILLLKKENDFWEACRENDIAIEVTKYPVKFNYNRAEQIAKEHGVRYFYVNPKAVKTLSKRPMDISGNQPILHNFINCPRANECIVLKHGKLYTCSAAAHAHIINDYFQLGMNLEEENGIDIYKAANCHEIMNFLAHPIPFCRYCGIDFAQTGYVWSQSEKKKEEWI